MTELLSQTGYRVVLEESWQYEWPQVREADRRWYERLPCRGGAFIGLYCEAESPCVLWAAGCPVRLTDCRGHGGPIFKLWTSRPKNARLIWEKVKGESSTYLGQMDGEVELYFPARLLPLVAEMAGARKRRRLSPEHRAKLIEAGWAFRFWGDDAGSKVEKTAQI